MKTFYLFTLVILLLGGCSQYNDPEIAQKIAQLEAKGELDDFDKEELKNLKEQAKIKTANLKECKLQ